MPIINLKLFGVVKQKKVYQKQKVRKYTTIVGEQIGICRYNLQKKRFEVYIQENEEFYAFTVESYKLQNLKYGTQLQNNKIVVCDEILPDVGNREINCLLDKYFIYLPFMAGIFCKGVLVFNNENGQNEFQLQRTTINWNHPLSKKYIKEYINNYEEIINEFRNIQLGKNREECNE